MAVVPYVIELLGVITLTLLVPALSSDLLLTRYQSAGSNDETGFITADSSGYISALGDPGMKSDKVRVAIEGWNFCNQAGNNAAIHTLPLNGTNSTASLVSGSPRWADCTDLVCSNNSSGSCQATKQVSDVDNNLAPGDKFPKGEFTAYKELDQYTVEKEKYLGSLCAVNDKGSSNPWNFWMVMLKNGNYEQNSKLCGNYLPSNRDRAARLQTLSSSNSDGFAGGFPTYFPCFGNGCMNQPQVFMKYSKPGSLGLEGGLYGTYDVAAEGPSGGSNTSFFSVDWYKKENGGSWNFHHVLRVNTNYPWLMLYLRADATYGESGGYPWDTRGMMMKVPQSPNFLVRFTLNVLQGGGDNSQFYLMDMGGCWKNNGNQCDGDVATDVTRYSEMIINPEIKPVCNFDNLGACPPIHINANGTAIHRNDKQHFPYSAYHYYCVPVNTVHAEEPNEVCDEFSNPQAQELQQLLPHPEWAVHGYPASVGEGWIGKGKTWDLDVGALSSRLFFYQDPGTTPAVRKWPSLDIGTEIFNANEPATAEWVVSDFNVLVPST